MNGKERGIPHWLTTTKKTTHRETYALSASNRLNCGVCTAVCPAAEVYDYSPREVMNICQSEDEEALVALLKSDRIWFCGQCFSCKTRCPRCNSPATVILALRRLSVRHGYFAESEKGRQQLLAKRIFGENLLSRGYTLVAENISPEHFPELGDTWEYYHEHMAEMRAWWDVPMEGCRQPVLLLRHLLRHLHRDDPAVAGGSIPEGVHSQNPQGNHRPGVLDPPCLRCQAIGGCEFPHVLVGLLEAFGAEIVDYPERRHCCGMGFRQCAFPENRGYTASSTYKKLASLREAHPDCHLILTNCPGCTVFLDAEQGAIREMLAEEFNVSVLDYAQLTGLMLGYDPFRDCGLNVKAVEVEPLLDQIGIPYDRSKTAQERRRPFAAAPGRTPPGASELLAVSR